ncbi:MsnO8 family LLM class oxidoreductase [Microbacterium sp. RD1]|uniref:MsnO8 family LLM class oxidoreductase n=1 Tax=Microbacterium sp. RD1 TaxID=3457313 RepID=UPI003FA5DE2D
MRISLLDRSRTRAGQSDAEAVASTIERAVRADELGFDRFWTAEHHAVPGIASAAPTVMLAAIGARTHRIRIGTGGVMVPNHAPLVVAEQALLLEALYPGRVDLGLGGSLGFTPAVRQALGRTALRDGEYAAEVDAVLSYLEGRAAITARPRVAPPGVFLLAIRDGLTIAAQRRLPAVVGGPLLNDPEAIAQYRSAFPDGGAQLMVSVDVAVADTAERARDLLLPEAWALAHSRQVGEFRALQPVSEVKRMLAEAPPRTTAGVRSWLDAAVFGTPDEVETALRALVARTGATELLATVSTYEREDTAAIDRFLASLREGGPALVNAPVRSRSTTRR